MPKNPYLVPIAILAGGIILAIAIFTTRSGGAPATTVDLGKLNPVTAEDHMVGNPAAKVIVVEYSDIDCQYCKSFQSTLAQVMSDYAATGEVAWVYRHFPVVSLHQYAAMHAEAAECAALQGGNDAFFRFIDLLHQQAPGGTQFDPVNYPSVVTTLGLSTSEFEACMDADTTVPRVTRDFENAMALGAKGTPFSVILIEGQEPVPVTGALPYENMKQVIEEALKEVGAN